jgi:hypothetical protein
MAYTAGFEFDLFVSYASVDDELDFATHSGLGWVSFFVKSLESALAVRLGGKDKLRIYFDRRNLHAHHQLEELLSAARRSALFLAIASPAYAARKWTREELGTFVAGSDDPSRRVFCVERLPLDEGAAHPAPLDTQKRNKFWERDSAVSEAPMVIQPDDRAFRARVHDLAEQIKRQLVAMHSAEMARPVIGQAADIVVQHAAEQAKRVVYLAEVTDDLEEERLQVARYLDQYGYRIVPELDLPGGGDAFRAAVRDAVKEAHLYVQLLGSRAGRRPSDLPEGYGAAQLQAATATRKPIMAWRRPDLDVDAVADPAQRELLGGEHVIACGLQQFMEQARRWLDALAEPAPRPPPCLVFIDAARQDQAIAKITYEEFGSRGLTAAIPVFDDSQTPEAVYQDLTENMKECDVIVFIFGDAPPTWLRSQMRLFNKVRPGASIRTVAVFVGPPEEKPDDVGFTLPGLRRIDFRKGWSPEAIRQIVEELGA